MQYHDFVLQLGATANGEHIAQVLASPAGEGAASFKLPLSLEQVEQMLLPGGERVRGAGDHALGRDLVWTGPEPSARLSAQQVGDLLFKALFSGQVRSLYDQSLGALSSRKGIGLRLKLKLDTSAPEAARLGALPWELLWRHDTQDFVSLSRTTPLVRYLDVPRPAKPLPLPKTLSILVVTSIPSGLASLDAGEERRLLEEASRSWKRVKIERLTNPRPSELRRALVEHSPHVLHFIGHGSFDSRTGAGALHFAGEGGASRPLASQDLATLLKDCPSLVLVVLNACETARAEAAGQNPYAGVANALVLGGIPAVVAMQSPVSDRAAIAFSGAFYQRLAEGDPVDAAVVEGRQAILAAAEGSIEWATPVLFLRVPDGYLFHRPRSQSEPDAAGFWGFLRRPIVLGSLSLALSVPAVLTVRNLWVQPTEVAAAGQVFEIDQEFASSLEGLSGALTKVELMPNGRMRYYFRLRNSTGKDLGLGFDPHATYIADGAGNRYPVLAASVPAPKGEAAVEVLPPGAELERWLEFPAPLAGERKLKVALASHDPKSLAFPLVTVELPDLPEGFASPRRPAPPLEAGALALTVTQVIESSVEGLRSEVRGVELLTNGRMRWRLSFLNDSDGAQVIGFQYGSIYLVDQLGNRYPVLTSDTGGRSGQVYRQSLLRALRADHWLEFGAPFVGAQSFKLVLSSHDQRDLRFAPFTLRLPKVPPQYTRPAPEQEPVGSPTPPPEALPEPTPQEVSASTENEEPEVERPLEPTPRDMTPNTLRAIGSDLKTTIEGLTGQLVSVDRIGDSWVRWSFTFHNGSPTEVALGFLYSGSYLADNLGNRYGVHRAALSDGAQASVAPGASQVVWFDFPIPTRGAKKFTVVLASSAPQTVRFRHLSVEVDLPK